MIWAELKQVFHKNYIRLPSSKFENIGHHVGRPHRSKLIYPETSTPLITDTESSLDLFEISVDQPIFVSWNRLKGQAYESTLAQSTECDENLAQDHGNR